MASKKKARIFVANDDTTFLELMETLLEEEGYDSTIWKNGDTAYLQIKQDQPDLVILDIRMGDADKGWQVLDLLRLDPDTVDIPVIVCSAASRELTEKSDHLASKKAMAVAKPFELNDLLDAIDRSLKLWGGKNNKDKLGESKGGESA